MKDRINSILNKEQCGEVSSVILTIGIEEAASPEAVRNAVNGFAFESGWLCLTDRIFPLYAGADLAAVPEGIILSGELAGANESLHIRQYGERWRIARITVGSGDECLKLDEEYISTENGQRDRLRYEVYWKRDEKAGYRPWAGRFTGLVKGGNNG